jgi:hypothetical protein
MLLLGIPDAYKTIAMTGLDAASAVMAVTALAVSADLDAAAVTAAMAALTVFHIHLHTVPVAETIA